MSSFFASGAGAFSSGLSAGLPRPGVAASRNSPQARTTAAVRLRGRDMGGLGGDAVGIDAGIMSVTDERQKRLHRRGRGDRVFDRITGSIRMKSYEAPDCLYQSRPSCDP